MRNCGGEARLRIVYCIILHFKFYILHSTLILSSRPKRRDLFHSEFGISGGETKFRIVKILRCTQNDILVSVILRSKATEDSN